MLDLNGVNLGSLTPDVNAPTYDRTARATGIVHFGVGHFHRSHQAMYLDRLMRAGQAADWAVCGAGVMAGEDTTRDILRKQDYLYTLTVKQADGTKDSTVIGSLDDFLYAPDDPSRVVERIAHPDTRIVGLTITEGGYNVSDVDGKFLGDTPALREDLRSATPSRSVFGLVFQAAALRMKRGLSGFTVMSCDNIQGNGAVARTAFLGFAYARDSAVADWIQRNCTFPNSMVDRVTPRTTTQDVVHIWQEHAYVDNSPVTCEPFHQWVLQDDFAAGRPAFEDVGVQVVHDVEPYERMKLALANGTHQALCYFGHLLGHTYVHEALADPDIRTLVLRYIDEEAVPTLQPIPGVDLGMYGRTVVERFSNPAIQDELARICAETSDRIPKFLMPVARARLAGGARSPMCAATVASWARYVEGTDEDGQPINVVDPRREELMAAANTYPSNPTAFIENKAVFGDISHYNAFVEDYAQVLGDIHAKGTRAALRNLLSS
ncbi:MAG TPA: mannitol dehydrogenase family protein [Actinocrinis sp.]|jgi:mannitol 2-dehydrogenase|uniref:mannitol dehydrogenase family protein n=1 Tax=Actinocrinis sp. TaxID=1920516 RepID=UPI002DDC92C3|nr:mannitol dehydrogenase family protein [Actinocrinis sp.]HEV3173449.1 mannitol dehydrogenase family protein [Actinocrinis sp.]